MKIQTFTIVAGSAACNADCPYCVSRMTGKKDMGFNEPKINWRNFNKACRLAQVNNVSTVLITGKGEPTLFPKQLTKFLENIKKFNFPLIELQTNGLVFGRKFDKYKAHLKDWYNLGLNTIAISIAHYKKEKNEEILAKNSKYIDLGDVIKKLHDIGYSIRLSCMMMKGYINDVESLKKLVEFCKKNNVEQLTIRTIRAPKKSEDSTIYLWTKKHELTKGQIDKINKFLEENANKLMTLKHGGIVYDLDGQNICSTDCLTINPETEEIRQLIFFPDGHLRYDWQYKGAVLL